MGRGTAVVAISKNGAALARSLSQLDGETTTFLARRWYQPGPRIEPFDLPLKPVIQDLFGKYDRMVLFMPVGVAVRLLAPSLAHKYSDPAVVCVDDAGRYAVSLLSGHVGGADALTEQVAEILGAEPVITSASHVTQTLAVDLLGQKWGWLVDAPSVTVTRASADVVNGEPVSVYQEAGESDWWTTGGPLPGNLRVCSSLEDLISSDGETALIITDRALPEGDQGSTWREFTGKENVVVYRPRSLVVGMGCRRGVPLEELEKLLVTTLDQHNLAPSSLSCIATAEVKRDEPGLIALAEKYRVPLQCFSVEKLNQVFEAGSAPVTPSENAHRLLGVWGVSEPAALLASGSRELLVPREKTNRATIALARRSYKTALHGSSPCQGEVGKGR